MTPHTSGRNKNLLDFDAIAHDDINSCYRWDSKSGVAFELDHLPVVRKRKTVAVGREFEPLTMGAPNV